MSNKRTTTAKEETIKAFSLLNFHHMVQYRVCRLSLGKTEWSNWSTLTDARAEEVINDSSIEDLQFSFKPDFE